MRFRDMGHRPLPACFRHNGMAAVTTTCAQSPSTRRVESPGEAVPARLQSRQRTNSEGPCKVRSRLASYWRLRWCNTMRL